MGGGSGGVDCAGEIAAMGLLGALFGSLSEADVLSDFFSLRCSESYLSDDNQLFERHLFIGECELVCS